MENVLGLFIDLSGFVRFFRGAYLRKGALSRISTVFYMKIKSLYTLQDTCCSQKQHNDLKILTLMTYQIHLKCRICLETFVMILTCLDDGTYQNSSSHKVYNVLVVANMSEKRPRDLCGGRCPCNGRCNGNHLQLI